MTAVEIFNEAARRGLRLEPRGDKLAVIPADKLAPDFADVLRANKPALLEWLSQPPCPGYGTIPPLDLPLLTTEPQPSICDREIVIHYVYRQTGGRPCPLAEWIIKRESEYYDGHGKAWDCSAHCYCACLDAAMWQLNRGEVEVWELLAGFDDAAKKTKAEL